MSVKVFITTHKFYSVIKTLPEAASPFKENDDDDEETE